MAEPTPNSRSAMPPPGASEEWLKARIAQGKRETIQAWKRQRRWVTLGKILFPISFLALWQIASGRWVDPFFISTPFEVGIRLWEWLLDGTILSTAVETLLSATYGFLLGGTAGIVLALLLGRITALYSLPRLALVPLFIIWLGIGAAMKITLTSVIVFFIVFYTTYAGVRDVPASLINLLRTMGASKLAIVRKVILPSAGVFMFTGLQVSVPYAVTGAVFGELVVGSSGLGWLLRRAQTNLDSTGVFAGLIVIMCVAGAISACVTLLQRTTSKWRVEVSAPVM
jgi:NitT/TauT family transport system permease protein